MRRADDRVHRLVPARRRRSRGRWCARCAAGRPGRAVRPAGSGSAVTVLAQIVSPPTGGITTPCSSVKAGGRSTKVTSVCQWLARAPLGESISSRRGWSGGDASVGWPRVSGPSRWRTPPGGRSRGSGRAGRPPCGRAAPGGSGRSRRHCAPVSTPGFRRRCSRPAWDVDAGVVPMVSVMVGSLLVPSVERSPAARPRAAGTCG